MINYKHKYLPLHHTHQFAARYFLQCSWIILVECGNWFRCRPSEQKFVHVALSVCAFSPQRAVNGHTLFQEPLPCNFFHQPTELCCFWAGLIRSFLLALWGSFRASKTLLRANFGIYFCMDNINICCISFTRWQFESGFRGRRGVAISVASNNRLGFYNRLDWVIFVNQGSRLCYRQDAHWVQLQYLLDSRRCFFLGHSQAFSILLLHHREEQIERKRVTKRRKLWSDTTQVSQASCSTDKKKTEDGSATDNLRWEFNG